MPPSRMLAGHGWPFDADRPHEDHGLFGPNSPTWRVWTSPTALIAFLRSIVVESFDPFLTAAVDDSDGVRHDLRGRLDSTLTYFTIVAIGDSRAAIESAELLTKVHARATGVEPISGRRYSANNPDSQLWIHVTGWHSNLYCYERYGPGPLSTSDEERYWADCVTAAELQTCDPAKVPRGRADVRDYYADARKRLCVSERAVGLIKHFLRPPRQKGEPLFWPASRALSVATVATVPRWMRRLGGFDQPAALDALARPAGRAVVRALTPLPRRLAMVDRIAPSIRPVWQQALSGPPPVRDEVLSPARARELYGHQGTRSAKAAG
ncbi:oxygenase MpaB family protein [Amycolatopsis samaneae]|uniref:Oxygenase MpaB family protein n=1 Tax=Amycolatopsis samaneae TaxID=664691 RepID=A0ABW5GR35_9PSEU